MNRMCVFKVSFIEAAFSSQYSFGKTFTLNQDKLVESYEKIQGEFENDLKKAKEFSHLQKDSTHINDLIKKEIDQGDCFFFQQHRDVIYFMLTNGYVLCDNIEDVDYSFHIGDPDFELSRTTVKYEDKVLDDKPLEDKL